MELKPSGFGKVVDKSRAYLKHIQEGDKFYLESGYSVGDTINIKTGKIVNLRKSIDSSFKK